MAPPNASGGDWMSPAYRPALRVRLLQLSLGPAGRILGLHALDGLRVHVDEDVLDERLGRLPTRRPRISGPAADLGRLFERDELGISIPQGVLLPVDRGADDVAVVHGHPLVVLGPIHEPAQEFLCHLLVLRVLHDRAPLTADRVEPARRPARHLGVVHGLGDVRELPLRDEVDAGAIDRRRDGPGQERAVVAAVVPGEPALVETVLPERDGELEGLDRLLAVDGDLALVVDLGPSETPRDGIRPAVRIAQAVAERLTDRTPLLLELGPELAELVERVRKLAGAQLLEPVLAIVPRGRHRAERHRLPAPADDARLRDEVIVAAVALADLLGDVVHVGEPARVEVRPV